LTALAKIPIAWIPVTYINSWVDHGAERRSEYYKDILGNVHLRLGCRDGITANPFTMPVGYRPGLYIYEPIRSQSDSTTIPATINIYIDGVVTFQNYTNPYCLRGEIIYRAEN